MQKIIYSYVHNADDVCALTLFTVNTIDTNAERRVIGGAQLHQPELAAAAFSVIM